MIPVPRNNASERSKKEITPFEYPQVKNLKYQYKYFHTNSNPLLRNYLGLIYLKRLAIFELLYDLFTKIVKTVS